MSTNDLVCFSHLRWGFEFARPNHLMVRFARRYRTFFVEEPRSLDAGQRPRFDVRQHPDGPRICVPWVPAGLDPRASLVLRRELFMEALREHRIYPRILWFYTPMALEVTGDLDAPLVVYDCMEEMSTARGARPDVAQREAELLKRADLVFTGDQATCRALRMRHNAVYRFPNDFDRERVAQTDVATAAIPRTSWDETFEQVMDCIGDALVAGRRATSVTRRDFGTSTRP